MCYISSVAVVLTWSHDELTSHTADPLLYSAVNTLRKRMEGHLLETVVWPKPINESLRADTDAAISVINLCKVSVGGAHHLKVAVHYEIEHRDNLLRQGVYQ